MDDLERVRSVPGEEFDEGDGRSGAERAGGHGRASVVFAPLHQLQISLRREGSRRGNGPETLRRIGHAHLGQMKEQIAAHPRPVGSGAQGVGAKRTARATMRSSGLYELIDGGALKRGARVKGRESRCQLKG